MPCQPTDILIASTFSATPSPEILVSILMSVVGGGRAPIAFATLLRANFRVGWIDGVKEPYAFGQPFEQ